MRRIFVNIPKAIPHEKEQSPAPKGGLRKTRSPTIARAHLYEQCNASLPARSSSLGCYRTDPDRFPPCRNLQH
ncbi:MAG: hypothetical protein WC626_10875 [Methanoregula sp.]